MQENLFVTIIRQRLDEAFSPTYLKVEDESHQHIGHQHYHKDGSHFSITISADCLKKLTRVEAHRQIYAVLDDLMKTSIHALRIVSR